MNGGAGERAIILPRMSPPGRPKGEYRSAKREGNPIIPPGRPKGEYRSAEREGNPISMSVSARITRIVRHGLALTTALALCGCAALDMRAARDELADAERAFARQGLERGVRAAFIEYFAPDGVAFEPAPVRVREVWPTRPAPADPLALRLEWRPALVAVARARDLGYSTGPYQLTDTTGKRPPSQGLFFSVWQRQSDGQWKVWLDIGSRTAAPVDETAWAPAPRAREEPQPEMHPTATALTELDRELSGLAAPAFAQRLALDARHHEEGMAPLIGAAWVDALARRRTRADYLPGEARVSASGDLAATYGRISRRTGDDPPVAGHYVHVWLRTGGSWWLAVEAVLDERG
jgi:ketosteroid isomerase-like protein